MFNKKYGDFGYIRLPTIILSGILAIIVLFAISHDLIYTLINQLSNLNLINFDIPTLFNNWKINFHILDLSFLKLSVVAFVIFLGIVVMIASFKHSKEKITKYGKTFFSLIYYMGLYSFFLTMVWFMIGVDMVRKKVQKW